MSSLAEGDTLTAPLETEITLTVNARRAPRRGLRPWLTHAGNCGTSSASATARSRRAASRCQSTPPRRSARRSHCRGTRSAPSSPRCGLILVPVGGGLGDPEAGAQPADVRPVPEPRQREDRLLPAAQGARSVPGADLAAVRGQQARHERDQWQRDVKDDTIGQHAEPPGRYGSCGETSCTGGSAPSRGSPVMSARLPVAARMGVTPRMSGSSLLRKPHYLSGSLTVQREKSGSRGGCVAFQVQIRISDEGGDLGLLEEGDGRAAR